MLLPGLILEAVGCDPSGGGETKEEVAVVLEMVVKPKGCSPDSAWTTCTQGTN